MKMTKEQYKAEFEKTYDIDGYMERQMAQDALIREYNNGLEAGDKASVMSSWISQRSRTVTGNMRDLICSNKAKFFVDNT